MAKTRTGMNLSEETKAKLRKPKSVQGRINKTKTTVTKRENLDQ